MWYASPEFQQWVIQQHAAKVQTEQAEQAAAAAMAEASPNGTTPAPASRPEDVVAALGGASAQVSPALEQARRPLVTTPQGGA